MGNRIFFSIAASLLAALALVPNQAIAAPQIWAW